jgi:hypothetical protein
VTTQLPAIYGTWGQRRWTVICYHPMSIQAIIKDQRTLRFPDRAWIYGNRGYAEYRGCG